MGTPKKMNEAHAETIIALARCNMNISEAARVLCYIRQTIQARVNRIKAITGLDPCNFFDLHELYTIAREILGDEYEPF